MDRAGLVGSWAGPEGGHASVYLTSKSEWEELNQLGVFVEGEGEPAWAERPGARGVR